MKKELWKYLKSKNTKLYRQIRGSLVGNTVNLPGYGGRKVVIAAYKAARKFIGFN